MFEQNVLNGPGTGSYTTHTLEILIMLGVAFLLGLWLGWVLWSRYRQIAEKMRLEHDSLSATANALRIELDNLKNGLTGASGEKTELANQLALALDENQANRAKIAILESENNRIDDERRRLRMELGLQAEPEPEPATPPLEIADDNTATPALPAEPQEENMPVEEADEPVDETSLAAEAAAEIAAEVDNETEMHALSALHEAHGGAGLPQLHDDDILEAGLDHLDVDPPLTADIPDNIPEEVAAVADNPIDTEVPVTIMPGPHDDLKIVEGIGPKIEEVLFRNGIHTYTELARTPVSRLKDILTDAGPRFAIHDPGTWSAQALLAANGEWENLKAYQEFLNAGKKPK